MNIPINHISTEHKIMLHGAKLGYQEKRLHYPRGHFKSNGYLMRRVVVDGVYYDFTVRKLTKEEL